MSPLSFSIPVLEHSDPVCLLSAPVLILQYIQTLRFIAHCLEESGQWEERHLNQKLMFFNFEKNKKHCILKESFSHSHSFSSNEILQKTLQLKHYFSYFLIFSLPFFGFYCYIFISSGRFSLLYLPNFQLSFLVSFLTYSVVQSSCFLFVPYGIIFLNKISSLISLRVLSIVLLFQANVCIIIFLLNFFIIFLFCSFLLF